MHAAGKRARCCSGTLAVRPEILQVTASPTTTVLSGIGGSIDGSESSTSSGWKWSCSHTIRIPTGTSKQRFVLIRNDHQELKVKSRDGVEGFADPELIAIGLIMEI